jgi:hypothetical protein
MICQPLVARLLATARAAIANNAPRVMADQSDVLSTNFKDRPDTAAHRCLLKKY